MEVTKVKITCPLCKKPFAIVKPEKPGVYQVNCPHKDCGRTVKVVMQPKELKMGQGNPPQQPADNKPAQQTAQQPAPQTANAKSESDKATQPAADIRMVGKPEKTDKGIYLLKTPMKVGEKSAFVCPGCGKSIVMSPKAAGGFAVNCPACATRTVFRAVAKPQPATDLPSTETKRPPVLPDDVIKSQKAELVWGTLFNRHKAQLKEGVNWVGRKEPSNPSDIMVDDKFMSAHSFYIEKDSQKGICKLYVERATNPVKVNGVECKEGNSVVLNFGDTILAGKTTLCITKSK